MMMFLLVTRKLETNRSKRRFAIVKSIIFGNEKERFEMTISES